MLHFGVRKNLPQGGRLAEIEAEDVDLVLAMRRLIDLEVEGILAERHGGVSAGL